MKELLEQTLNDELWPTLAKPWMRGELRTEDVARAISEKSGIPYEAVFSEIVEGNKRMQIAQEVLGDLSFEAKQAIIRKVVDTIVGTQLDIKVYGHMSLNSSIIANICRGGIQDVKFETECRYSRPPQCG